MLSPPFSASFELPEDGSFESIGGYWWWLLSGKDKARKLSGKDVFTEKNVGAKNRVKTEEFQDKILKATWHKIRQNQKIFWRFEQNILDFRRYYVHEGKLYRPSDSEWICDGLEVMSEYIDQNFW